MCKLKIWVSITKLKPGSAIWVHILMGSNFAHVVVLKESHVLHIWNGPPRLAGTDGFHRILQLNQVVGIEIAPWE